MKNLYYGLIALGIIALAAGAYLFLNASAATPHHLSKIAALAVGAILLIAGVIGLVMGRPKAIAK
jgi:uncharacterized membrane protein HdeD (DUF308 family)